jgi:hypothetical protein
MLQKISFGLIAAGTLLLVGWIFKGFFTDPQIPLLIRIAVGTIGTGFILLIGTLIADRLQKRKNEKNRKEPKW